MKGATEARFREELTKVEIIAGLHHALDLRYRHLRDAARGDWERLFGNKDLADSCVTIRVATIQSGAIRGCDFLKSRRQSGRKSHTRPLTRFAH
ncbi:MAG TPA: hypothetical protein VKE30_02335 [Chthoniobacterales bacterium]|nr:hypothetical protein [Chthoniobacterales bacterium]